MSDRISLKRVKKLSGRITPPADKSISHRAVILSSLAKGKSIVRNFLRAEDTMSTLNAFRKLGVKIEEVRAKNSSLVTRYSSLVIHGKGLHGLRKPKDVIDCGNSGTTARLMSGILAGNPFFSVLTGDASLRQRPMARVINPLKEMGAEISGRGGDKYLPMAIKGRKLKAIKYAVPVASAQVKSALLLAGLYADGVTEISEPIKSRDHTERMLKSMGAYIEVEGLTIRVQGFKGSRVQGLNPIDITIPADFSSAAFFIAGTLIIPDSKVSIKNVGINPTRTGLLEVLKQMGANIELKNTRDITANSSLVTRDSSLSLGEPVADIYCKTAGSLKAVKISRDIMPSLIDEFPILCVLATQADGITEIRGAEELRVKESDRIKAMAEGLRKMGVEVKEFKDGLSIKGKTKLKGALIDSHKDHRIAMSFSVAALIAKGKTTINGISSVNISFPGFFDMLRKLSG